MDNFDIIIIGAGNAGLTLAAALPGSLNIAIVDHKAPATLSNTPKIDGRKIALNYGSQLILDEFKLWSALAPHTTPIDQVHISQQGHFGTTRLTATENKTLALGYVIPAESLSHALQTHTATQENIRWFYSAKLITLADNATTIQHENTEKTLSAKLIIAADGVQSQCRKLLAIETLETDYEQTALVTRVKLKTAHQNIAYERFLADGSLALLPMQDHCYGVVWLAEKTKLATLNALSDADLLADIQKNFGYRLGRFTHIEQRFTYPIRSVIATKQVHNNYLLLGDAAHQMSPVAAQGFNLTLQDIYCLVNLLRHSCEGRNPDDRDVNLPTDIHPILEKYLTERLPEQQKIIQATHKLMKTFQSSQFPLPQLRSTGLTLLDLSRQKKRHFSELFMGLTPSIQKLLRKRLSTTRFID